MQRLECGLERSSDMVELNDTDICRSCGLMRIEHIRMKHLFILKEEKPVRLDYAAGLRGAIEDAYEAAVSLYAEDQGSAVQDIVRLLVECSEKLDSLLKAEDEIEDD